MAMQQARAKAEAQMRRRIAKFVDQRKRMEIADQAVDNASILVASIIYLRLAHNRTNPEIAKMARKQLSELTTRGRKLLNEIDVELTAGMEETGTSAADSQNRPAREQKLIVGAFDQYEKLAREYSSVPQFSREAKSHIARQRGRPQYARVLHEPEAKQLWILARQHEFDDETCCAFLIYRKAKTLTPAPSAVLAAERLEELAKNPQVVAASKACRELESCHKIYARAERLTELKPEKARELFFQVVRRSPSDSTINMEALKQIRAIDRRDT